MKKKTIIIISIAMNVVMLSALGYIAALPVEMSTEGLARFATNAPTASVSMPVATAAKTAPAEH